jgi:hypothetical protein
LKQVPKRIYYSVINWGLQKIEQDNYEKELECEHLEKVKIEKNASRREHIEEVFFSTVQVI